MNLQLVYRNISSLSKMKICFTKKKKQTNKKKKILLGRESNSRPPTCKVNALGSFSIDDEDGSEKVTFKMNSPFFQTLSRLFQFTENVKCGRISLELISWGPDSSLERERKIRRRLFTFSINREIRHFHVYCTFKVVLLIKPIVFFAVLVAVAVVVAKAPYYLLRHDKQH